MQKGCGQMKNICLCRELNTQFCLRCLQLRPLVLVQLCWYGVCSTWQRAVKGTGAGFAWGCCWRAFSQDRHLQLLKVWRHTGNYPSSLSPQQPLPPCHHMSLIYLWFLHFHSQAPGPPSSHLQTPSPVTLASQPGSATALLWQLRWGGGSGATPGAAASLHSAQRHRTAGLWHRASSQVRAQLPGMLFTNISLLTRNL